MPILTHLTQFLIFFTGCLLTMAFICGVVVPFIEAHPQVILPGAIGDALGFLLGSPFLVVRQESDLIRDFLIAVGLPPCGGIALGFAVGLALGK